MELEGVYVPLVTPFEPGGGVDYPALERLAGDLLDGGAAGLVALGTTAEPDSLTAAEKSGVVGTVAGVCGDRRAQLIVGAHNQGDLAEAAAAGADAALTLVPPFVRPGEAGVVAYFEMLAATTALPIVAYHVPYRTGQALSPAALLQLAAIPGVAGVHADGAGFRLSVREIHATLPRLIDALRERTARASRLSTRTATLDDVFVELTGTSMGEEDAIAEQARAAAKGGRGGRRRSRAESEEPA